MKVKWNFLKLLSLVIVHKIIIVISHCDIIIPPPPVQANSPEYQQTADFKSSQHQSSCENSREQSPDIAQSKVDIQTLKGTRTAEQQNYRFVRVFLALANSYT